MNNNSIGSQLNWRTIFLFGFIVVIGIGIIATVYITRQRTNQRSKAAASTTLSFNPAVQNVGVGQIVTSTVHLDPGSNQVSLLKLVVSYDSTIFDQTTANIKGIFVDPNGGPGAQGFSQVLQVFANDCSNGTICKMSITMSIGSSPTTVITQPLDVATVTLKTIAQTTGSGTQVAVDPASTVLSLAPSDQSQENVLLFSSLIPLTVNVSGSGTPTPPVCNSNQSTCAWDPDPVDGAVSYAYVITDATTGSVIQQGTVNSPQTSVQFTSIAGKTYKCSVTTANICGSSSPGVAVKTCPLPTVTPTSCPTPGTVTNLKLSCPSCGQ